LPSTETNGQNFLRRPGPTKGCRANNDDDDDDDDDERHCNKLTALDFRKIQQHTEI